MLQLQHCHKLFNQQPIEISSTTFNTWSRASHVVNRFAWLCLNPIPRPLSLASMGPNRKYWAAVRSKYFSHPSFSYLLLCNPTHETETTTANGWGTTNSKPPGPIIMTSQLKILSSSQVRSHLDQSLWRANRKYWAAVRSYLLHSCLEVHTVLLLLRATACNYAEPKPFSWAKPAYFHVSSSNFNVQVTYWAPLEMLLARWATGNWYPPTYPPTMQAGWHVIRKHFVRVFLSP